MATSPGPTRVITMCDDPPGTEDTSCQELPQPYLRLPVDLGNYHWEEERRGLLSRRYVDQLLIPFLLVLPMIYVCLEVNESANLILKLCF